MAAGLPAELATRLTHRDTAPAALVELLQLWAPQLASGPHEPSYQFDSTGPHHRPVFTCTLTVNAPAGYSLPSVTRSSYNKNTAKREAAKAMGVAIVEQAGGVRVLSRPVSPAATPRAPSPRVPMAMVPQHQWAELQQTVAILAARVSALEAAQLNTPMMPCGMLPLWGGVGAGNGLFLPPPQHGPPADVADAASYYSTAGPVADAPPFAGMATQQ